MKRALVTLGLLVAAYSMPLQAADKEVSQADNNYYWEGTRLYNLGRLGEAFESFEKAIQRKQNSKEAEAYLMQIRQEIVNNVKNRKNEQSNVNVAGSNPDAALNVIYVEKGHIRVLLQAKLLFDENTSTFKSGAVDTINKVADMMQGKEGNRIEITLINEMDNIKNARDVDAERALAVYSLINFKRLQTANAG